MKHNKQTNKQTTTNYFTSTWSLQYSKPISTSTFFTDFLAFRILVRLFTGS